MSFKVVTQRCIDVSRVVIYPIGRALFKTGDFDGALEHYRKVLTIDQKIAGDEHPDTATSLANIADILKAQGKYDEAEKDIERSLHIRRNILGIHPDTAKSHSQLGLLYHIQMKYDEALAEHEKALEIALELLGENHQEVNTLECSKTTIFILTNLHNCFYLDCYNLS